MGIHGLSRVIGDNAPDAVKEHEIKNYFGRKVAIDASMSLYQFLIAVRSEGQQLTNDAGEITSHLTGFFYRTIRMIECGIKPVYVFDGKPPGMKSGELEKRIERRKEAEKNLEQATEEGEAAEVDKFSRRTVRVTKEHNEECRKLLKLMGVPYILAPCEAEAQCAALARAGKVFATASEDMDSLTFGTPVMLRHLTFSEARKLPITEFNYDKALQGLDMTPAQFVDLCILLGCDYCDTIKGVGPKKAVEFIKKHKSIEETIKHLDKTKYPLPDNWNYEAARKLFNDHDVLDPAEVEIKWEEPNEEELVQFMVKEKGFNEDRIRNGVKRLMKHKGAQTQQRLDGFFQVIAEPSDSPKKRKLPDPKEKDKNKKAKTGGPAGKGGKR